MANLFDKGDSVEITSGEHMGVEARVIAFQEIGGKYQYGVSGVPGLNGNLYSVHEEGIIKVDGTPNQPVITTDNQTSGSDVNGTTTNLAEQLRQVADIAAQSETETYSKYDMILNRLDEIDKRMEVKEIKVVVEVQHTYNRKEFETYSDEDRLEPRNKFHRALNKNQLSFLEGEEE